jgi:hypothetical protein
LTGFSRVVRSYRVIQETNTRATENPYATPASEGSLPARNLFQDIPTKELKKLRNDSHTIRAVAALLVLGLLFILLAVGLMFARSGGALGVFELLFILFFAALNSVVLVGLIRRENWGRILGFVSGTLMLIGIPIGTLIGVLFMVSLARGKRLFGPDRLVHKQLEAEWKYRKRNKVE